MKKLILASLIFSLVCVPSPLFARHCFSDGAGNMHCDDGDFLHRDGAGNLHGNDGTFYHRDGGGNYHGSDGSFMPGTGGGVSGGAPPGGNMYDGGRYRHDGFGGNQYGGGAFDDDQDDW